MGGGIRFGGKEWSCQDGCCDITMGGGKSRVVLNVSEGYVFSVAESDAREATTVSSNGAKKPPSKQSRNEEINVLLTGST